MTPPVPADSRLVIRDVNTVGWHAVIVEPDNWHHGWAFSIGFTQTFDHPEVAVFGLPTDVLREVLDVIGRTLQEGRSYADGQENDLLAPPYRCVFRGIDVSWRDRLLPDQKLEAEPIDFLFLLVDILIPEDDGIGEFAIVFRDRLHAVLERAFREGAHFRHLGPNAINVALKRGFEVGRHARLRSRVQPTGDKHNCSSFFGFAWLSGLSFCPKAGLPWGNGWYETPLLEGERCIMLGGFRTA